MEQRRILGMTAAWFTAACLAVLAIVVLSVGTLDFGWFLSNQNLTHQIQFEKRQKDLIKVQNQNTQSSMNVQEGYITAIQGYLTGIDDNVVLMGSNPPNWHDMLVENIQDGRDACAKGSLLTGTVPEDPQMVAWLKRNCQFGTLNPASSIWKGSNG